MQRVNYFWTIPRNKQCSIILHAKYEIKMDFNQSLDHKQIVLLYKILLWAINDLTWCIKSFILREKKI